MHSNLVGSSVKTPRSQAGFRPLLPVLFLWLTWTLTASADPLDHWIWRSPQPFGVSVFSVVRGNGIWLAAANTGLVATSPDGISWDLASIGTNGAVSACAYGTNRFVLGSSKGVFLSTDGHNWSKAVTQINTFSDIAYGNGAFVAVNAGSTVSRSTDGSAWVNQNFVGGVQSLFNRVSFANGRFFILGYNNSSTPQYFLFTSPDGNSWSGPVNFSGYGLFKVVYGNGVHVGVNQVTLTNGTWSEVRTSTDGTTWSAPTQFTNHIFSDAVFANGQFTVLDESGRILNSADGTNWVDQPIPALFAAYRMNWDSGLYVAASVFGNICTSTDSTNWVLRTTGAQNSLVGIIHTNGLYVAAGGNVVPGGGDPYSVATIATSPDGRNWVEHNPGTTNSLVALTYGNGRYVAVGTNGAIVTSTDATNWSAVTSPVTNMLWGVAYGNGRFVAVSGNTNASTFATSSDGLNWTAENLLLNFGPFFAITYAQGQFVALGATNTAMISSDGLLWQPEPSSAPNTLRSITYGNGVYVAAGDHGALVSSSDGVTWTNLTFNTVVSWRGIAYGNGWYVAVGSPSVIGVSTNAVNWTLRNPFGPVTLTSSYGIVAGNNSFLLAGPHGLVLESQPFNPPAPQITLSLRVTDRPMLSFTGPELHGYEIDSSDTLPPAWQLLVTDTNLSHTTTLPVNTATNPPARFYRVLLLN